MVFYGEPSISTPSPENFTVNVIFDLMISICNHLMFVLDCIKVVNLAKFLIVVCKISC